MAVQGKTVFKKIITALIIIQLFSISSGSLAVSDGSEVLLEVSCNNNGICETGETESNCPHDCGCNNDGICQSERGEDASNCPGDCEGFYFGGYIPDTDPPVIYELLVDVGLTQAIISWKTNEDAYCTIYFGETEEYGKTIELEHFQKLHSAGFFDLTPDTLYHFNISCRDNRNNQGETGDKVFTTMAPPDVIPPSNVSNFTATPEEDKIILEWENPPEEDFDGVLIVRSEDFYPQSPWEGQPVYLGRETRAEDIDVKIDVDYYYTAFSFDRNRNFSSGAIAQARLGVPPAKPPVKPPIGPPPPEVEELRLEDFRFFQKGKLLPLSKDGTIEVEEGEPLTVLIDYDKVPEVLKTIMVSLEKDDKYFSFLLRINEEKTRYEATLLPPEPGVYPVSIYVLDFKNQALKKITGIWEIFGRAEIISAVPEGWRLFRNWLFILIFVIALLLLLLLRRKSEERRERKYWLE